MIDLAPPLWTLMLVLVLRVRLSVLAADSTALFTHSRSSMRHSRSIRRRRRLRPRRRRGGALLVH